MILLALDTSGPTATAAVTKDGFLTGEISLRNGKTHSQKVVPMIEALLEMLDLKPSDISLLAVANGPGSFTGLRIGVVTMKALAYALNIPLVEVSTLMALAATLSGQDIVICPIMDARNRQVYTGIYKMTDGNLEVLDEECGITIEALTDRLKELNSTVHFIGDAVPLYQEYIRQQGIQACFATDDIFTHRAATVAQLAWSMHNRGVETDAFQAAPNYLRKSQAERMKDMTIQNSINGELDGQ